MKQKEIGGYFELELLQRFEIPQAKEGALVNSARNALELILSHIKDIKTLLIPYFTCEVILEPLEKLGIPYRYYSLNDHLELQDEIILAQGEYLLYTNYFGIKDSYIAQLDHIFGQKLIVDNAQALFADADKGYASFYSPRKFVGVADGGIAVQPSCIDVSKYPQDTSFNRYSHLLKRIDRGASEAYDDFKTNSKQLAHQPIKRMSKLTESILRSIDYTRVRQIRLDNFYQLHQALACTNLLPIDDFGPFECPLVYPYFTRDESLRQALIDQKVYVATYWPNVLQWCEEKQLEYQLSKNILAIPLDQRYNARDMEFIINHIQ